MRILNRTASRLLRQYYLGPDHPMKIRFWNWLWAAVGHARLQIPYATAGWLSVDLRDWLQGEIFATGAYEPEVWESLAAYAMRDEVVWDVGAHIGSFSVRGQTDPRVAEVHAFEPNPQQLEVLRGNLQLNRGRAIVHAVALSDRDETRGLRAGPDANTGLATLAGPADAAAMRVDCRTADELIFAGGLPAPTLLKVDVEGWEPAVFDGARRMLAERPPKAIVYEDECRASGEAVNPALARRLEECGYRVTRIARPSGDIQTRENFLAVRA